MDAKLEPGHQAGSGSLGSPIGSTQQLYPWPTSDALLPATTGGIGTVLQPTPHEQVLADPEKFKLRREALVYAMMADVALTSKEKGDLLRVAKISKKEIDLHMLYEEVTKRDGEQAVILGHKWTEVARVLGAPDTCTNMATLFRNQYERHLHHFEQVYFHGQGGLPVVSFFTKDVSSNSGDTIGDGKPRGARGGGKRKLSVPGIHDLPGFTDPMTRALHCIPFQAPGLYIPGLGPVPSTVPVPRLPQLQHHIPAFAQASLGSGRAVVTGSAGGQGASGAFSVTRSPTTSGPLFVRAVDGGAVHCTVPGQPLPGQQQVGAGYAAGGSDGHGDQRRLGRSPAPSCSSGHGGVMPITPCTLAPAGLPAGTVFTTTIMDVYDFGYTVHMAVPGLPYPLEGMLYTQVPRGIALIPGVLPHQAQLRSPASTSTDQEHEEHAGRGLVGVGTLHDLAADHLAVHSYGQGGSYQGSRRPSTTTVLHTFALDGRGVQLPEDLPVPTEVDYNAAGTPFALYPGIQQLMGCTPGASNLEGRSTPILARPQGNNVAQTGGTTGAQAILCRPSDPCGFETQGLEEPSLAKGIGGWAGLLEDCDDGLVLPSFTLPGGGAACPDIMTPSAADAFKKSRMMPPNDSSPGMGHGEAAHPSNPELGLGEPSTGQGPLLVDWRIKAAFDDHPDDHPNNHPGTLAHDPSSNPQNQGPSARQSSTSFPAPALAGMPPTVGGGSTQHLAPNTRDVRYPTLQQCTGNGQGQMPGCTLPAAPMPPHTPAAVSMGLRMEQPPQLSLLGTACTATGGKPPLLSDSPYLPYPLVLHAPNSTAVQQHQVQPLPTSQPLATSLQPQPAATQPLAPHGSAVDIAANEGPAHKSKMPIPPQGMNGLMKTLRGQTKDRLKVGVGRRSGSPRVSCGGCEEAAERQAGSGRSPRDWQSASRAHGPDQLLSQQPSQQLSQQQQHLLGWMSVSHAVEAGARLSLSSSLPSTLRRQSTMPQQSAGPGAQLQRTTAWPHHLQPMHQMGSVPIPSAVQEQRMWNAEPGDLLGSHSSLPATLDGPMHGDFGTGSLSGGVGVGGLLGGLRAPGLPSGLSRSALRDQLRNMHWQQRQQELGQAGAPSTAPTLAQSAGGGQCGWQQGAAHNGFPLATGDIQVGTLRDSLCARAVASLHQPDGGAMLPGGARGNGLSRLGGMPSPNCLGQHMGLPGLQDELGLGGMFEHGDQDLLAMAMDISGGGASGMSELFGSAGGAVMPGVDGMMGSCGGWMGMAGNIGYGMDPSTAGNR